MASSHFTILPPGLTPIPTRWNGYRFRSRLEARWAVAFTEIGLRFEYEPDAFPLPSGGCYLPDFWFPQVSMWGEVKPAGPNPQKLDIPREAIRKGADLAVASKHPLLFLDGPPTDQNYWAIWPDLDPLDPIGWDWQDVYLWEGHAYHLTEHRLYVSCGCADWPDHGHPWDGDEAHPAILAARGARFDGRAA